VVEVGLAVVVVAGLAVVAGAGATTAPAGRQISRPGYSGVFTVAPLTVSRSDSSSDARSAMPIQ
jgi:hypothetical protein